MTNYLHASCASLKANVYREPVSSIDKRKETGHMEGRKEIVVPPAIPSKLQELIYAFRESKALFAACDLGIFDLLHESDAPQSAKQISSKMDANVDATTRLMDTLVALELLQKTKEGESWLYSNTDMSREFLTKSSPNFC